MTRFLRLLRPSRARRRALATDVLRTLVVATALVCALPAHAQQGVDSLESRRQERREEYEQVARSIQLSEKRIAALSDEVDEVKADSAALTAALIQAAKTERKLSEDIDAMATRLDGLEARRDTLRESLKKRRGVLAEVLGALERMGMNPPPAILVRPEDALASVRSAILLGAVVPDMRRETQRLVADLEELSRVATSIGTERERLEDTVADQIAEKKRLDMLLEQKHKLQARKEAGMAAERRKAQELAEKAGSLQDLIASLETDIASLREEEARRERAAEKAATEIPDANGLAAARPFGDRRGEVAPPVPGAFGLRFGDADGTGGTVMGDILRTQSSAIVTAPADGTVLYAGPFRSYGQLLILNAGGGYHIVLAGLGRINVSLGQSVLAGEPLGTMGETRVASIAALGEDETAPELYVEIRKDGNPVDPAPWWAERISGRTGNDT